jgi:hypothetical protein
LDNRLTSSSEVTVTVKPKTGETISNGKFLAGMVTVSLILLYPVYAAGNQGIRK